MIEVFKKAETLGYYTLTGFNFYFFEYIYGFEGRGQTLPVHKIALVDIFYPTATSTTALAHSASCSSLPPVTFIPTSLDKIASNLLMEMISSCVIKGFGVKF